MLNPLLLHALVVFYFRIMIHAHVPQYFLKNTLSLPATKNLGIEVMSAGAYPVLHFIDEFTPTVVIHLLLLRVLEIGLLKIWMKGLRNVLKKGALG